MRDWLCTLLHTLTTTVTYTAKSFASAGALAQALKGKPFHLLPGCFASGRRSDPFHVPACSRTPSTAFVKGEISSELLCSLRLSAASGSNSNPGHGEPFQKVPPSISMEGFKNAWSWLNTPELLLGQVAKSSDSTGGVRATD